MIKYCAPVCCPVEIANKHTVSITSFFIILPSNDNDSEMNVKGDIMLVRTLPLDIKRYPHIIFCRYKSVRRGKYREQIYFTDKNCNITVVFLK